MSCAVIIDRLDQLRAELDHIAFTIRADNHADAADCLLEAKESVALAEDMIEAWEGAA